MLNALSNKLQGLHSLSPRIGRRSRSQERILDDENTPCGSPHVKERRSRVRLRSQSAKSIMSRSRIGTESSAVASAVSGGARRRLIQQNSLPISPEPSKSLVHQQSLPSDLRRHLLKPSDGVTEEMELEVVDSGDSSSPQLTSRRRSGSWKGFRRERSVSPVDRRRRLTTSFKLLRGRTRDIDLDPGFIPDTTKNTYLVITQDKLEIDTDFLVQRVPSYDGFLNELLSVTDQSHPDYEDLCKASAKVQSIVKECGEELSHVENEYRIDGVQDRFPHDALQLGDKKMKNLQTRRKSAPGATIFRTLGSKKHGSNSSLGSGSSFMPDTATASTPGGSTSAPRVYVQEGSVQLTTGLQTQDRYLFLFNDLLLIGKQKSSTTFKLKHRVRVCEMWTASCLDDVSEGTHSLDRSFVMGWPTTNTVATFPTPDLKERWLQNIKEQIDGEKEKEEPKSFMLKVLNRDIEGSPASKMISVGNRDEARALVQHCLEEFNIADGQPKDYQLWVVSGKEESPYPLIGHEHPYSIKMSHLRDACVVPSSEENIPMDVEAESSAPQCQFILRQSKKPPIKHSLEDTSNKRAKKSKKSPLMNFFKKQKSISRHPAQVTGKLFGRNLTEISNGADPPKPVMDMLHFLFMNGPFTPGIFRKSANHRICKELREKLDLEGDVSFEDQPVHVVAAMLKEFLRSLPESLFLSDLYDQWTEIVQASHEETEKTKLIQNTLLRLPECHVSLIKHLLCVLYHIAARSEENNMNSFNLAICVGQSLLWPPESKGPAAQAMATRHVPLLVQFLVDHVGKVMGEECMNIFGAPPTPPAQVHSHLKPPRQDSGTDSDSMHSLLSIPDHTGMAHRDNSSIDSLERELYSNEMDCSPQLLKSHLSNTNLSRDSGLTLSDNQLYEDTESELSSLASQSQRSQYLGRSVSQMEEQLPLGLDPGKLSSSHEGALNIDTVGVPTPVAPPRRTKRRVSEPHEELVMLLASEGEDNARSATLKHSSSTASDLRKAARHPPLSKRISNESLGSVEENPDQRIRAINVQRKRDIGFLRKSESGAHLFMNEDPEQYESLPGLSQSIDICRKKDRHASKDSNRDSGMSASSPLRHSWGDLLREDSNDEEEERFSSIDLDPCTVNYMSPSEYHTARFRLSPPESPSNMEKMAVPHFPTPTTSAHEVALSAGGPDSHASHKLLEDPYIRDSHDSGVAEDSPPLKPPKVGFMGASGSLDEVDFAESSKRWEVESAIGAASFAGSPPPKVLLRSAVTDPEKHFMSRKVRAGMTSKGSDMFPKHIREVLRNSLQEEDLRSKSGNTVDHEVKQAHLSNILDSSVESHLTDSGSLEKKRPTGSKLKRQKAIERCLSDPPRNENTPPSGSADWKRPEKPPSYQEAIQRKSLLKSGMPMYSISTEDIKQQREIGAKARQLYEDSMKRYMEEASEPEQTDMAMDPSSNESFHAVPNMSPPPYHRPHESHRRGSAPPTAVRPAEKTSMGSRTDNSQNNNCGNVGSERTHERTPPRETSLRRTDSGSSMSDRERALSRESRGLKVLDRSCRSEGHSQRKSGSKSRDRSRGHRLSDTRLESSGIRQNKGSNLSRSKSDSSEHINKIGRFKELQPLESNVWDKYRKARSKSEGGPSLEDLPHRQRRKSGNSVKHRDWHKELAEQYSKVFYQPPKEQKPTKPGVQYAYVRPMRQESVENGEKPKRRWTPPVHPTKDLIVTGGQNQSRDRDIRRRPPVTRTNSKPQAVSEVHSDSQRSDTSDKENYPGRKVQEVPPTTQTVAGHLEEEEEEVMFTVSVKQLRNLWDNQGKKDSVQVVSSKSRPANPPPYRNPPSIKQNEGKKKWPASKENEESYV